MPLLANRYELVRTIGRGGMGEVYEALDRETQRTVAIKQLRVGPGGGDISARFRREILAMAQVTSKHVIAIHDAGIEDGEPYLVMEYLHGEDLGTIADRLQVFTVDAAVRLAAQVCDGLIAVHAASIVHRDIKPANLMLLAPVASGSRILKILDFGIARVRAATELTEMTQTGAIIGSPLFMAPEQLRGVKSIDQRADVWAVGVVLYRLLCGRVPHARDSVADQLITVCSEPAPPLRTRAPWVSDELAAYVHRALAIDVDARIPTARAFADGLARWLREGSTITDELLVGRAPTTEHVAGMPVSQSLAATPPPPKSKRIRPAFVLALGASLACAAGAIALRGSTPSVARVPVSVPVNAPVLDVAPNLANTGGAAWFARTRPHCTAFELHTVFVQSPAPHTPDGAAFAIACVTLAGDLDEARKRLYEVLPDNRAYASGVMFELAHELAQQRNADPMVGKIMPLVLEVWPDNYQADYDAGLVEFQIGDAAQAAHHLDELVRLHPVDDPFTRTARTLLDALAAPARCGRKLRDPFGHPIVDRRCHSTR